MNIPNLAPLSLDKNGNINPAYLLQQQQQTIALQKTISDTGLQLPSLTADEITQLNDAKYSGKIVYNTTTHKAMINENGIFKTITTS